jgi:phosphate uptake regulator
MNENNEKGNARSRADAPRRPARPRAERTTPHAGTTRTGVLLPGDWLGGRGLTVGSHVQLRELPDGSLLLRPLPGDERRETFTVPMGGSTPPEHVFRQLIAAYLAGANEFVLAEADGLRPATRALARTFARRTATPELVSEDGRLIVLRDSSEGTEVALPHLLRRMFRIAHDMQETAGGFLDPAARLDLTDLTARDDEVDRLGWHVERTLARRLDPEHRGDDGADLRDAIPSLLIARAVERVADHAVILGENAARLADCPIPEPVRAALHAYHAQALDFLEAAFQVAERPEIGRANELLDTGEALHAAHATLTESFLVRGGAADLTPLASAGLGQVLQSIDRTTAYAQDIAEVGLDRAVATRIALGAAAASFLERSDERRPDLAFPPPKEEWRGGDRSGPAPDDGADPASVGLPDVAAQMRWW